MLLNYGAGEDSWKSPGQQGNQPRRFTERTEAEAEAPILWPPEAKSWLTGKDSDAVKDWGQQEKWETQDKMVGWHHWLNGHDFEQTLEYSEGQGSHGAVHGIAKSRTQPSNWTTTKVLKVKAVLTVPSWAQKPHSHALLSWLTSLTWPTNSVLFHACSACPVVYLPFASTSMDVLDPYHYCLTTPLAPKNQPAVLIGKETKSL